MDRSDGDFEFWTLECNLEKKQWAEKTFSASPISNRFHFVHGKIADVSEGDPIDTQNIKTAPLHTPVGRYDVVLLDGGDDSTYAEYLRLKKHAVMFICDDTTTNKCRRVARNLRKDNDWECLADKPTERNGWCAFQRTCLTAVDCPNCLVTE